MTKNQKNYERKSKAAFLYLFAALARRASHGKNVNDLKRLSSWIEAEITKQQHISCQNNSDRF